MGQLEEGIEVITNIVRNEPTIKSLGSLIFQQDDIEFHGNLFAKLANRQEFLDALDRIIIRSYNFPRSVDDIFHDPGLLLIISFVCILIGCVVILLSLRHRSQQRKKKIQQEQEEQDKKNSSNNNKNDETTASSGIPRPPQLDLQFSPAKSESVVNTEIDIDEFMHRLFASGILVTRHKPNNVVKTRCLKLNDQCDICIFKQFKKRQRGVLVPTGGPYMRLPLSELKDCFLCDGATPPTFILEFTHKTIQLSAEFVLDNNYLVTGFKGVLQQLKKEPNFIQKYTIKFQNRLSSKNPSSAFSFFFSPSKKPVNSSANYGEEDDMHSVSTINTMATR